MGKKNISQLQKQKLNELEKDLVIAEVLRLSQKRFKKFDEVIVQLYANEAINQHYYKDPRILLMKACFETIGKSNEAVRKHFKDLLIYLDKHSLIIKDDTYLHALLNVAKFAGYWRKSLFEWMPLSRNQAMQFNELVAYLFCKYPVAEFLFQAFFEINYTLYIHWFIHLGNGGKAKELEKVPIAFTQKMGHYFLQSPSKLNIPEALRWAQVMGLGGNTELANRIANSWIGNKPYEDEDMWEQFIRLVITGDGMFNYNKVTELIDFVRESKRANKAYHLKGRTLQSLMRQSDEWHAKFSAVKGMQTWKPCGIDSYKAVYKNDAIVLEELTEAKQLQLEGKAMKHCVASYAFYCTKGKTAIFSMRKYSYGVMQDILATIEVNLSLRKIVQAKAKMNKPVCEEAKKHMAIWAEKQLLSINVYL